MLMRYRFRHWSHIQSPAPFCLSLSLVAGDACNSCLTIIMSSQSIQAYASPPFSLLSPAKAGHVNITIRTRTLMVNPQQRQRSRHEISPPFCIIVWFPNRHLLIQFSDPVHHCGNSHSNQLPAAFEEREHIRGERRGNVTP